MTTTCPACEGTGRVEWCEGCNETIAECDCSEPDEITGEVDGPDPDTYEDDCDLCGGLGEVEVGQRY